MTEEQRAYHKAYYAKNKKRIERYRKAYYRANRESICQRKRAKYALDPEFRAYEIQRHKRKRLTAEVCSASHADREGDQSK